MEPTDTSTPRPSPAFNWKPVRVNGCLLSLLAISCVVGFKFGGGEFRTEGYVLYMLAGVALLGVVNGLVAVILAFTARKDLAPSFFLSAILVVIAGAGLCYGGAPLVK